jgi:RNA polymerase sigma-70 factor (ECF subfamily)
MDDRSIINLYLARDDQAIAETEKAYGAMLVRFSERILENCEDAEEVENDTLIQCWNRIPPNTPYEYFRAFLLKIARHLSFDRLRTMKAQKRNVEIVELTQEMAECLPGPENVESRLEAQELRRILSDFLAGCPQEQRAVFLRRYWYFDSIAEIGRLFGYREEKVKSILFRMRKALKKRLEKEGYTV